MFPLLPISCVFWFYFILVPLEYFGASCWHAFSLKESHLARRLSILSFFLSLSSFLPSNTWDFSLSARSSAKSRLVRRANSRSLETKPEAICCRQSFHPIWCILVALHEVEVGVGVNFNKTRNKALLSLIGSFRTELTETADTIFDERRDEDWEHIIGLDSSLFHLCEPTIETRNIGSLITRQQSWVVDRRSFSLLCHSFSLGCSVRKK